MPKNNQVLLNGTHVRNHGRRRKGGLPFQGYPGNHQRDGNRPYKNGNNRISKGPSNRNLRNGEYIINGRENYPKLRKFNRYSPYRRRNGRFPRENSAKSEHHRNIEPIDMDVDTTTLQEDRQDRHHEQNDNKRYVPPFRVDKDGDMIMEGADISDLDLDLLTKPRRIDPSTHELFLPVKFRLEIETEQIRRTQSDCGEHLESCRHWFESSWVPNCACKECIQGWNQVRQVLSRFNPNNSNALD